jgi:hypothetical protein
LVARALTRLRRDPARARALAQAARAAVESDPTADPKLLEEIATFLATAP